ncbi:Hypothetical predicted protein [Mytilus galloprovincialis]|uniref:Uncharacterized protein n=1 Tax=Mytilus galloprovincialis TaxID=29158 RepID=A0A8B6EC47_MYTGA|nr:Hypothetical predicted protein [Mytilus galloprovincialis]
MSILNLGFQSLGLMREKKEHYEKQLDSANSLGEIRKLAEKYPTVEEEVLDSVEPVRILLSNVITRLKWKDKNLKVFNPATEDPEPLNCDKYKSFDQLYGKPTSEKYRPSLVGKPSSEHGLPFSPSSQYAKNVEMVVLCSDCDKPRVLYSNR